jgi:hypothetical protein
LGGATTGALIGSAAGPIGTVAGGVIGGAVGYLSSGGSGIETSGGDADSSGPRSNFTFGSHNALAVDAQKYAQQYGNQGALYRGAGALNRGDAANAYAQGDIAQRRTGPQIAADPNDVRQQASALGYLQNNADTLQRMGTAPQGPSYAEAQLHQGQDAAMQQSLALAHSGRTLGSGAAAQQQAEFQNAQGNQQVNQQAAAARIQEQNQYNQYQLGALGAAQQGYGAMAQQANALSGQGLNVQQQNAGLTQQQQQINNQTTQTYGQVGQGLNAAALSQEQLGQGYDQMGWNTLNAQLSAAEQYQNQINGNSIAQQGLNNQQTGQYLGAATSAAAVAASDRDAKKNIVPAGGESHWYDPLFSWKALGGAISGEGGGHGAPQAPGGLVHDPNNPSRMISHYANIGMASNMAGPGPMGQDQAAGAGMAEGARSALDQQAAQRQIDPGTAPDTWGYAASDERVKTSRTPAGAPYVTDYRDYKKPESPYQPISDATHYAGHVTLRPTPKDAPYPYRASDEHSKNRIRELEAQVASYQGAMGGSRAAYPDVRQPDTGSLDEAYSALGGQPSGGSPSIDLRPARGYSYEYKDPERHGQGRFFGPMAQDLEKTEPGASVVKQAPDGTKMVDTSRLSLVNTSAISEQQRRMQELQAQVDALSGGRSQYPQVRQPNTIDLDRGMRMGGTY